MIFWGGGEKEASIWQRCQKRGTKYPQPPFLHPALKELKVFRILKTLSMCPLYKRKLVSMIVFVLKCPCPLFVNVPLCSEVPLFLNFTKKLCKIPRDIEELAPISLFMVKMMTQFLDFARNSSTSFVSPENKNCIYRFPFKRII